MNHSFGIYLIVLLLLQAAYEAHAGLDLPFALATCGWIIGPLPSIEIVHYIVI